MQNATIQLGRQTGHGSMLCFGDPRVFIPAVEGTEEDQSAKTSF